MLRRSALLVAFAAALAFPPAAAAAGDVTSRADSLRTGWYRDQPQLSPGQVTGGTFGRLFDAEVEGQVYAQPLVSDGRLLIATETNDVYGLDAVTGARTWHVNLGTPFNADDVECGDLYPYVGVTATPVIDGDTAYMTSKTYVGARVAYKMHALDLATGAERPGFPVEIRGDAGNAPGKAFNAKTHLQRPALLLLDGVVYAAFGGHCDFPPYQGWVAGVSTTGHLTAMWTAETAPGADGAGIWHAGGGLMSDGPGRIFLATGNFNSPPFGPGDEPPGALGQSVVRVDVQGNGTLKTKDFFAPFDADVLDGYDADFGSGGPVGLPSKTELPGSPFGTAAYPDLLVAVGKVGYVYLLDRDGLGGRGQGGDDVVARIGPYGGVWSSPAVWPGDGGWVYIPTASPGNVPGGSSGALNFYRSGVDGQSRPTLSLTASTTEPFGFGSSAPVVTSDGMRSGSALVWLTWSPGTGLPGSQLRAYAPNPAAGSDPKPVWSAPIGVATKFAPPGVAAGRVYVATADGHVYGYGSPVDPALTGPDVVCGQPVAVGSSRTCEATFTARRDVHVTGVDSTSAAFAPDAPALPRDLHAGDELAIPVTFTPAITGPAGASVRVQTTDGQFALGVSGTGIADGPLLAAGTPVLSFGGVAQGRPPVSSSVIFRNAGSKPLTIDGVDGPSAPFAISGAPDAGDELEPGAEVPVQVQFDPAVIGDYADELTVRSSGGDVEVGLAGSVRTPPLIALAGSGDFGDVVLGQSAERTVTLTNGGGSRLTITKSKPPVGGAFVALTSLPEGSTVAPGRSVSLTVRFTPSAAGPAHGGWTVTGDDGGLVHDIAFDGNGVSPAVEEPPGIPETPLAPVTLGAPPAPPKPPVVTAKPKPKLSTLHAKTDRRTVSVTFKLDRAAKVRIDVMRAKKSVRHVTVSGRRGANRASVRLRSLRAGRYVLRLTPAGGRAVSRTIRVPR